MAWLFDQDWRIGNKEVSGRRYMDGPLYSMQTFPLKMTTSREALSK